MNYITRLNKENEELKNKLHDIQEDLTNICIYLNSSKFHGDENNWVSAAEMINKLRELRMKTIV